MLLHRNLKLTLQGSGSQHRRYLYAGDVANALNILIHRGAGGSIYNLGSTDDITNRGLCTSLLELIRPPGYYDGRDDEAWIKTTPGRPVVGDEHAAEMDCSKLRALGWKQKVSMEEGLRRTVEWYKVQGETWWGDVGKTLVPSV